MNQTELVKTIEIKDKTGRVVGTKEVVTYPGLLSKAHEEGLRRIATKLVQVPSDENGRTAIARAFVETAKGRFAGIGDANPDNVSTFIAPHLIRMAETRAKARALRDAVNIGIVSFEELDGDGFANGSPDLGSGDLAPSDDDMEITNRLVDAGKLLGIEILDHIILGGNGSFLSFRERNLLDPTSI